MKQNKRYNMASHLLMAADIAQKTVTVSNKKLINKSERIMNTIQKSLLSSGLLASIFLVGCRSERILQGNLRIDGRPIETLTSVEPVFSFNNLDTGQRGIRLRTEYKKGQFKIYELPQGNYHIFISINANTDNPGGYPGYPWDFYKRLLKINIPGQGNTRLDVDLEKIIHLTLPQDNGDIMDLWGVRGEGMITFKSPIEFAWESLGDNVEYHYKIHRMQSEPFRYLEHNIEESTTKATGVTIELADSKENEFYLFHLYATKNDRRIGELKTHGKRGYGNDLRFRIK